MWEKYGSAEEINVDDATVDQSTSVVSSAIPIHGNATEPKLGDVERVDDWWLGWGVYPAVDPDPTVETVAFVEEAVRHTGANGKERPHPAFNDPNRSLVRGARYTFAYDLAGTVLALPADGRAQGRAPGI